MSDAIAASAVSPFSLFLDIVNIHQYYHNKVATVLTGAVTLNVAFLATKASDPHTAQVFYFWALAYVASALQVMIMRRGGEKTDNVARPGFSFRASTC
jgi:hypothetical protein